MLFDLYLHAYVLCHAARVTSDIPFVMLGVNSLYSIYLFPYFLNILLMALPGLRFCEGCLLV